MNSTLSHFLWISWVLIISVLSFLPGDQLPEIKFELFSLDTAVHFVMYAILSILLLNAWIKSIQDSLPRFVVLIIVGLAFGFLVEIIQGEYIYRRFFDWDDVIANTAGTLIAALLYLFILKRKKAS